MNLEMKNLINMWYKTSQGIVTFDFDSTLTTPAWDWVNQTWTGGDEPNWDMIAELKRYAAQGKIIHIVTSRHPDVAQTADPNQKFTSVEDFVAKYQLPVAQIHYTAGEPKGPILQQLGSEMHHDDDEEEINSATDAGVQSYKVPHLFDNTP